MITPARQRNRIQRLAGFTIMELVVTVAAMSIMMAAFGNILLQCKRVVNATHRTLRMNHRISVITDLFRRDVRRITKDGFLCITQIADGVPAIVFTTAGPNQSVLAGVQGYGSIVAWGIVGRREKDSMNTYLDTLWRPEFIFAVPGTDTTGVPDDVADFIPTQSALETLKDVKTASHGDISTMVDDLLGRAGAVFMIPPPSKVEADKLWMAVCRDMAVSESDGSPFPLAAITWTDYSEQNADGSFEWYGLEVTGSEEQGSWQARVNPKSADAGAPVGAEAFGGAGGYRALWTSHEPGSWPKAIKLKFWIDRDALPEGFGQVYEVVCDIP